jgi:hypothetical protein
MRRWLFKVTIQISFGGCLCIFAVKCHDKVSLIIGNHNILEPVLRWPFGYNAKTL